MWRKWRWLCECFDSGADVCDCGGLGDAGVVVLMVAIMKFVVKVMMVESLVMIKIVILM